MREQRKRFALDAAVFREVNDRIANLAILFGWRRREYLEFVCECGNGSCIQRIEMTRGDYEAVRAEDTQFALCPGHADLEIERVISSHAGYEVVAKFGPAAELARATSSRAVLESAAG